MKIGEFVEKISHKNFIILFLRRLSRFVQMKITRCLLPFATLFFSLSCWSCVDRAETGPIVSNGRVEVRIAPPPATTRTALGDDGVTTEWIKDDRIALWAFSDSGSAVFEREPFTFWSNKTGNRGAFFVGSIPAMPTGTYRYYAAYPYPESVSGSRVTYEIPAEQDGTWRGELDIMLASASAPELVPADPDRLDDVNELALGFSHKIHALKVTVPAGRNLFGRPVTMLRVRFPRPVTGRMTWDLAAPDSAPSMEGTGDAVTLRFARPVGEGDSFWVFIAPGDMRGGEVLFTASDGTEFTWPLASGAFGDCTAGRITPVNLTLPEIRPSHDFRIAVDPVNLGEAVTEINSIVCPEGYVFPSLDNSNRTERVTPNGDGTFSVRIFNDMGTGFPDNTVSMTVGSANAEGVFGRRCEVRDVTASGCTIMAPYLFFEDFTDTSFNDAHAEDDNGSELSGAGLVGWTGTRWKVDQQSLEFRTHIGSAAGPSGKYGRVDSPPLPLRAGSSVKVALHYEIGAAFSSGASTLVNYIHPDCLFGLSTDLGTPSGGSNGNQNYPEIRVEEFRLDKDGSPTNQPTHKDNNISEVRKGMRLTWFGYFQRTSNWAAVTGADFYYYLDNIRVTIVP